MKDPIVVYFTPGGSNKQIVHQETNKRLFSPPQSANHYYGIIDVPKTQREQNNYVNQ